MRAYVPNGVATDARNRRLALRRADGRLGRREVGSDRRAPHGRAPARRSRSGASRAGGGCRSATWRGGHRFTPAGVHTSADSNFARRTRLLDDAPQPPAHPESESQSVPTSSSLETAHHLRRASDHDAVRGCGVPARQRRGRFLAPRASTRARVARGVNARSPRTATPFLRTTSAAVSMSSGGGRAGRAERKPTKKQDERKRIASGDNFYRGHDFDSEAEEGRGRDDWDNTTRTSSRINFPGRKARAPPWPTSIATVRLDLVRQLTRLWRVSSFRAAADAGDVEPTQASQAVCH